MSKKNLPFYADGLDAFHRAADLDLTAQLAAMPLEHAREVLDLACGDGYFSRVLVREFGGLKATAADSSEPYRDLCQTRNRDAELEARIEVRPIDATAMDFAADSFDAVFCAYSFQSIPEHAAVLEECRRVLRRDGTLLLMETDGIHNWLLPLPTGLELRIRQAELTASSREGQLEGWTFSRRCGRLLRDHGFRLQQVKTFAIDRYAPFDSMVVEWLNYEFSQILSRIEKVASTELLQEAKRYLTPEGDEAIVARADSFVSSIHTSFVAAPN